MSLSEALASKSYDEAKKLVADDTALGFSDAPLTAADFPLAAGGLSGATLLKLWQKLQADKIPPASEDEEPKDTTTDEYIEELVAELAAAGLAAGDAGYVVKQLMSVGFYLGGRAAPPVGDTGDVEFDGAQGAKSGMGVVLLPSGDVYAGQYGDSGTREGVGALRGAAGTAYAGNWLAGKRHGHGSMTYKDGGVYTGNWKYGKRHGTGTFMYAGGDSYAGEWHAGQKHGSGKYTAATAGCVYEGTWKFGKLVASKLVLQTAQDAAFYGAFDKYGRPTGAGSFAFGSGVSLTGSYAAPAVEEPEGDEPPTVLPATWSGDECGAVEATSDAQMKAEYTTVKPVLNVIIAGAPASGKGTQAEKIVAEYGLFHLSTGDMLRAAAEDADNEVGQQAKAIMEEGGLVPDEIMMTLVSNKLSEPAIQEQGWLLDGFPRTAAQAKAMDEYFLVPSKCVVIDVPDDVLKARVTGRRMDPETGTIYHLDTNMPKTEEGEPDEAVIERLVQRADDTEDTLIKRLENFAANREAISTTFAPIAKTVDGNRDPAEVFADISKFLME